MNKDCKKVGIEKKNKYDVNPSIKLDPPNKEIENMFLASSCTHACLINFEASSHMTLHKEWFSQYESFIGDDVFLGNNPSHKGMGRGKVKMMFSNGICVSKIIDAGVQEAFGKKSHRMIRSGKLLAMVIWDETPHKLDASITICHVLYVEERYVDQKRILKLSVKYEGFMTQTMMLQEALITYRDCFGKDMIGCDSIGYKQIVINILRMQTILL